MDREPYSQLSVLLLSFNFDLMDIEKKRIVIIGGTGLIGKNLANHLLQEGYEPLILTRNPAKARRVFSDRIDIKKWNGIDIT